MGSIPLPALDIKQPPSPLDEIARVFQIQGLQQQIQGQQTQNQLGQLNLQQAQRAQADDAKWRAALTDPSFDGSPSKLLDLGLEARRRTAKLAEHGRGPNGDADRSCKARLGPVEKRQRRCRSFRRSAFFGAICETGR